MRAALHGAGAGDDGQLVAADGRVADAHDRLLGAEVERDQLVGLGDADGLGHARHVLEVCGVDGAGVAGDADGRAARARHLVGAKPHVADDAHDRLDVALGRVRFHHNEHR